VESPTGTFTIAATGGGGGGGQVNSVVAGTNISVDSTDAANPIVNLAIGTDVDFGGNNAINVGNVTAISINSATISQFVNGANMNISNSGSAGDIIFNTNGASGAMRIKTTTGNVGIGISAPTQKLDVVGSVKASTGFIGDLSGTATTATNLAGTSVGSIPFQNGAGSTAYVELQTADYVLRGGPTAPGWTAINTLVVDRADNVSGAAGVLYNSDTNVTDYLTPGTSGQILQQSATSAPEWVNQSSLSVGSATSATSATTATNLAAGSAGVIPYQSGSGTTAFSGVGSASQVLLSGGSGAPTWENQSALSVGTATNISGGSQGQILYQSASGTTAKLAVPASNQFLRYNTSTGLPNWNSPFTGGVLVASNIATSVNSGSYFTAATASGPYTFPANSIIQMSWLAQGINATSQTMRFGVQYSTDGTTWLTLGPGTQGTAGDPSSSNPPVCQTGAIITAGTPMGFSLIIPVSSALTNVQLRLRGFTNQTPTGNNFQIFAWNYAVIG